MSIAYDFLTECGVFFVNTINCDCPASRPFGAVMEVDGDLYLSTTNNKDVYHQIKENPHLQIAALKGGSRDWIRINGTAIEIFDTTMKALMIERCPILKKHFEVDSKEYVLFKVTGLSGELHANNELIKL